MIGICKGGPTMSPCYGCYHERREGSFHSPPMPHQLPMLCQPQEVQILWTVKKVPRQLHAIGELRPDQKVPRWPHAMGELKILICTDTKRHAGWLHTEGVPWREDGPGQLAQQHGNVRWHSPKKGDKPCNDGGKPKTWSKRTPVQHQNTGRLPVAPTIMAGGLAVDWCNTMWDGGSGTTEGCPNNPILSACHNLSPISSNSWSRKSSLWQVLMQKTASFHHHHYHCCCHHLLRIQSPPPCTLPNE